MPLVVAWIGTFFGVVLSHNGCLVDDNAAVVLERLGCGFAVAVFGSSPPNQFDTFDITY